MTTGSPSSSLLVPELGGALGRVAAPGASRTHPDLDGIRLALATDLFSAAGQARELAAQGDPVAAVETLAAPLWAEIWERAVVDAGTGLVDTVLGRFRSAAAESRMTRSALERWIPTEPERRAIAAHLGKGTRRLDLALSSLAESANRVAAQPTDSNALSNWSEAVDLCARRLEAAWIELLEAVDKEQRRWSIEVARVRHWHRPRWPMWIISGLLIAAATYLGLIFGGFIEPPAVLLPWADFWWERL